MLLGVFCVYNGVSCAQKINESNSEATREPCGTARNLAIDQDEWKCTAIGVNSTPGGVNIKLQLDTLDQHAGVVTC